MTEIFIPEIIVKSITYFYYTFSLNKVSLSF